MTTTNSTESQYMGITINKAYKGSASPATVIHSATLPNGQMISSSERKHVKKRIKKYLGN